MGLYYHLLKNGLLVAVILIIALPVFSQRPPIVIKQALQGSLGQVKADSTATVQNYYYYDTSYSNHITESRVRNIITVAVDEHCQIFLGTSFAADVNLRIYYPPDPDHPNDTSYTDKSFKIEYNKATPYTAKSSLVFMSAQKVTVKILGVTISANSDNDRDQLPNALLVENIMEVNAVFNFSCTNTLITDLSFTDSSVVDPDELYISWTNSLAADEYDLEWAWIDSSALSMYPTSDSKFKNNATRITTSNLQYAIPLMYDNGGRLFFRVRPVQTKTGNIRTEGKWSSDFSGGLGSYGYRGHQRAMNWQSSMSFAEDGKRKVVVQYFDGSLRSRQTVTKDNTSNTTVVSETFYDFQGRPVIQVLPSPTLNNIIKYTANFNVGINSGEYEKILYDTLSGASAFCSIGAEAMGSSSGASRYYSVDNPNSGSGIDRFIPDAKGFPFVETTYTQDNTGRISKQSGVGHTFKTGGEHETRYFYGTPDQKELDAVFGTAVGHYSHYFKTMVRDANGQYSVSYTDMHGRTIATALAGTPPENIKLDLLPSNTTNSITEKLSDPGSVIVKDLVMEHKKSLLVEKAGDHTFNYSLSPETLRKQDCATDTVCYDCLYDLKITITDDCNNQNLGGQPYEYVVRNFSLLSRLDTLCSHDSSFNVSFSLYLPEGNYEITKQLSVSRYAMAFYRDSVFLKRNSCKSLEEFILEQKAAFLNTTTCATTCVECRDNVGTWDTFRVMYMQSGGIAYADSATYREQAWTSYLSALESCKIICDSLSETDDIRQAMLLDMTAPSGQYANPDSVDVYSIFYSANEEATKPAYKRDSTRYINLNGDADYVFDALSGTYVKPNQLDSADFARNFKSSWADSLLKYHPEYCKLLKYEQYRNSLYWDRKQFESVSTYTEASAKGLLNPTNKANTPYNLFPGSTVNKDPLTLFSSEKASLEARMVNYQGRGITLCAMACMMVKCQDNSSTCYNYYTNSSHYFDTTTMCEGDLNMAWEYFKQMYLQEKRSIIDSVISASCPSPSVAAILAAKHHPNFWTTSSAMAQNGLGTLTTSDTTAVKDSANAAIQAMYTSNCEAYVQQWIQQLAPCNYNQDSLTLVIIPRLLEVCKEGSDINHPYGASSIKPSSANTFRSFEEVLKEYNEQHSIANSFSCNPELITRPKPYDQQSLYANKPITSKPDSCECGKLNEVYAEYQARGGDSSFSAFMQRTRNTVISEADLSTLLSLCNTMTSCNFLATPVVLPSALQCYTGDICFPCIQIDSLYTIFKSTYPNVVPVYEVDNDTIQGTKNTLFENFLNNRTGLNRTAQEYLRFMAECSIDLNVSGYQDSTLCETINQIVEDFILQWDSTRQLRGAFTEYFNSIQQTNLSYEQILNVYTNICGNQPIFLTSRDNYILPWVNCTYIKNLVDSFVSAYNTKQLPKPHPKESFTRYFNDYYGTIFNYNQIDSLFYQACSQQLNNYQSLFNVTLNCVHATALLDSFIVYYNALPVNKLYPRGAFQEVFNTYFGTNFSYSQISSFYDDCRDTLSSYSSLFSSPTSLNCTMLTTIKNDFEANYLPYVDSSTFCTTAFEEYFNSYFGSNYNYIQIDSIYVTYCDSLNVCGETLWNFSNPDFCVVINNHVLPNFKRYYESLDNPKPAKENAFINYFNDSLTTTYFGPDMDFNNIRYYIYKHCNKWISFTENYNGPYICAKSDIIFPPADINDITNCSDSSFIAVSNGTELYKHYSDSLKAAFEKEYTAKCMKAYELESFTVTRTNSIYHYTLYYYDQAGNLVSTVPPQGVVSDFSDTWLNNVQSARAAGTDLLPSHQLSTQYRYNTLNQVIAQSTPDAGVSLFWYDRLGRLVASQNAKQASETNYSYTLYDSLGRISEVGQIHNGTAITDSISRKATALQSWLNSGTKEQITKTVYDQAYTPLTPVLAAKNLRNRVSWTACYEDQYSLVNNLHSTATFYTYDIHGNVDVLIQDYRKLMLDISDGNENRFKKIVYSYDLVSGKVNHVAYQPNKQDAFYHKYYYDAENRITNVETSRDSVYWENDAYYKYYRHGPLARAVIGHQQVQGIDYAYTMQGWLKGVNASALNSNFDMGSDGPADKVTAADAFSFSLYYYDDDYAPINFSNSGVNPFAHVDAEKLKGAFKPLYNGNIAGMSTHLPRIDPLTDWHLLNIYTYDQLNRLKAMQVHTGFNNDDNKWDAITAIDDFKEAISYDANGNILTYLRNGKSSELSMDDMTYNYVNGTNKLDYIHDGVGGSSYPNDIDDQSSGNYQYDEIGNLIKDVQEGIDSIKWTVYGKIAGVYKSNGDYITYTYDAAGNRISKYSFTASSSNGTTSWYVRDAQGNVLGVYTKGTPEDKGNLTQSEIHLYGSSRLGVMKPNIRVDIKEERIQVNLVDFEDGYIYNFKRGLKYYELSNHLGNVLVTVTDKKFGTDKEPNGYIDHYEAHVVTISDYAPFGMQLVGRTYEAGDYRYGFNGKENDNDVKGEGNQQDYGFRVYDPRIGKFLSVDPLFRRFAWYTPYQFAGNTPIRATDLEGAEPDIAVDNLDWGSSQHSSKGYDIYIVQDQATKQFVILMNRPLLDKWYYAKNYSDGGYTQYYSEAPGNKMAQEAYWQRFLTREQRMTMELEQQLRELKLLLVSPIVLVPGLVYIPTAVAATGTGLSIVGATVEFQLTSFAINNPITWSLATGMTLGALDETGQAGVPNPYAEAEKKAVRYASQQGCEFIDDAIRTGAADHLIVRALESAKTAVGQTTKLLQAFDKKIGHAARGGFKSAFEGVKRDQSSLEKLVQSILQDPARKVIGAVTSDYYNASGQGVRIRTSDGTFVGFIEEQLKTR